jgi:hypothetical protein
MRQTQRWTVILTVHDVLVAPTLMDRLLLELRVFQATVLVLMVALEVHLLVTALVLEIPLGPIPVIWPTNLTQRWIAILTDPDDSVVLTLTATRAVSAAALALMARLLLELQASQAMVPVLTAPLALTPPVWAELAPPVHTVLPVPVLVSAVLVLDLDLLPKPRVPIPVI